MNILAQRFFFDGKTCSKCNQWFLFSWFNARGQRWMSHCKACRAKHKRRYVRRAKVAVVRQWKQYRVTTALLCRSKTPDQLRAETYAKYLGGLKQCGFCHQAKTLDKFVVLRDSALLSSMCKRCATVKYKEKRKSPAHQERRRQADIRRILAGKTKKRGIRDWKAHYQKHKEKIRQAYKKWEQSHPEARLAKCHKRRSLIRGNGGVFIGKEWKQIKMNQNFSCLNCGKQEPEIKLTVDHIVPVSRGGLNIASNIQGLCQSCNSRKRDRI